MRRVTLAALALVIACADDPSTPLGLSDSPTSRPVSPLRDAAVAASPFDVKQGVTVGLLDAHRSPEYAVVSYETAQAWAVYEFRFDNGAQRCCVRERATREKGGEAPRR